MYNRIVCNHNVVDEKNSTKAFLKTLPLFVSIKSECNRCCQRLFQIGLLWHTLWNKLMSKRVKYKFCHFNKYCFKHIYLIHWRWVTHICVSNLTSIGSDNGLSPDRHQAIIWTMAGILLSGPPGTNSNKEIEINRNYSIFIHANAFESAVCEMAVLLSRPQFFNHK